MFKGLFDGACNPNPGKVGLGACIYDLSGIEVDCASSFREYGTNNESEYLALILLMKRAIKLGITEMDCFGDSKLIINQVTGTFKASDKFTPYLNEVHKLCNSFKAITFNWIKRSENTRADELSKLGLAKEGDYLKNKEARANSSSGSEKYQEASTDKLNRYHREPKSHEVGLTIETSQPDSQSALAETDTGVLPQFKVSNIGKCRLLIQRGHKSVVIDLIKKACSCNRFRKVKECGHVDAIQALMPIMPKKSTVKPARLSH